MSEFIQGDQDPQVRVRTTIAERAAEQLSWIEQAAVQIGGQEATVESVFELPPEVRDDAPVPNWNEEQEVIARELGERLGYAAEKNVPSGVEGGVALLEGGKIWKMLAEAEALGDEVNLNSIVVSGSPHRLIGEDFVVVDGLYSWTEYKIFKDSFGDNAVIIAIATPRKIRHQRLAQRAERPLVEAEANARDYAEIENLEKGGPIANADYFLANENDVKELQADLQELLDQLAIKPT